MALDASIENALEARTVQRIVNRSSRTTVADAVAIETPVAMVYNGVSHAVMLASPNDLKDFALGFSLTEGIVHSPHEVFDIDLEVTPQGIELHIEIAARSMQALAAHRRSLAGRTGCGLCGAERLNQVVRPLPQHSLQDPPAVDIQAIHKARGLLSADQPLFAKTGAVHAAAWCSPEGEILARREDVGRHNALDKLIGHLRQHDVALDRGFLLITSRASFEMVHKAASQNIQILAAVSAPTSLAIQTAVNHRVTLIGFLRDAAMTLYSHPHRIELTHANHSIHTPTAV